MKKVTMNKLKKGDLFTFEYLENDIFQFVKLDGECIIAITGAVFCDYNYIFYEYFKHEPHKIILKDKYGNKI